MKKQYRKISLTFTLLLGAMIGFAQDKNVVDEIVWIVGDEAILKSEVENNIAMMRGRNWGGDPYCIVPEQLAVQKLFLHQATIDSVTVSTAEVMQYVEAQISEAIANAGSREKLEEYEGKSVAQLREMLREQFNDMLVARDVRKNLTNNIKVTPADVRRYFKDIPEDSIPYIPTQVEVQLLSVSPVIPQEEIDRVKTELRDYTDRVNRGESSFSTLARLYSEDKGSARGGGELGYVSRTTLVPAFANVAFSMTEPNKISGVVESEYGFHIIQFIDKKGEQVNVRHILRKPQVTDEELMTTMVRLDSLADDIRKNQFTFEAAVTEISDDKDTRNNNGLMMNKVLNESGMETERTSRFRLQDLPSEVAKVVSNMNVGEISNAFTMKNSNGKDVCVIVKLKNKINGHRATIAEDFQVLRDVVLTHRQNEKIEQWIREKQKTTYVRINDAWRNCEFQYPGWVK